MHYLAEDFARKLAYRIPFGNSLLTSSEVEQASLVRKKVVQEPLGLAIAIAKLGRKARALAIAIAKLGRKTNALAYAIAKLGRKTNALANAMEV